MKKQPLFLNTFPKGLNLFFVQIELKFRSVDVAFQKGHFSGNCL